jgi:hypothetical protein
VIRKPKLRAYKEDKLMFRTETRNSQVKLLIAYFSFLLCKEQQHSQKQDFSYGCAVAEAPPVFHAGWSYWKRKTVRAEDKWVCCHTFTLIQRHQSLS